MEKAEILRIHENYIRNSYDEIHYYEKEIAVIDAELASLIERDLDSSTFYSLYARLVLEKTLDLIQIEDVKADLFISRARVFFELGLMSDDERKRSVEESENSVVRYDDVEYKLMLLKLASIKDQTSKEYIDLVNYIYRLRSEGALLKQNVLKKDI